MLYLFIYIYIYIQDIHTIHLHNCLDICAAIQRKSCKKNIHRFHTRYHLQSKRMENLFFIKY